MEAFEILALDRVLLCFFAFLAGLIDAVVGGGGLIQLPAIMIILPGYPPVMLLGTNRLASACGTAVATFRYARAVSIAWQSVIFAAVTACIFSGLGAYAVTKADPNALKPLIVVLLALVATYTYFQRNFGSVHAPKLSLVGERICGTVIGAAIGFYDGFLGPGTGTFLVFLFTGVFGFSFLNASASAKIVNLATNIASLIYFAAADKILYRVAIMMAVCNVLGSLLGSHLAIAKGSAFVRKFFLCVVVLLIAKLSWDFL